MTQIEFKNSTEREAILQQYEQPPVSTITYIRDYEDGSGYVLVEQYTLEDIKNQKKHHAEGTLRVALELARE